MIINSRITKHFGILVKECYFTTLMNKVQLHMKEWMNLINIMLGKGSQMQTAHCATPSVQCACKPIYAIWSHKGPHLGWVTVRVFGGVGDFLFPGQALSLSRFRAGHPRMSRFVVWTSSRRKSGPSKLRKSFLPPL